MGRKTKEGSADGATNLVRLRGRVSTGAEERELPSGTTISTVRLSVAREPTPMTTGSRQSHDWVDCAAWGGRARRTVAGWRAGDVVEVEGALRRRFYRGGGATSTRLEVEVLSARTVTRAPVPSAPGG
jgi:single-strand DNA-binding protein